MPNIENRLHRVETSLIVTEPEEIVIKWIIVSPPPRDVAGNIVCPAPPPCLYVPEAGP